MENKEIEKLESIASFASQDGGIQLIEATKVVVMNTLDELSNTYKDKSRDELISLCARLQANLSLFQLLSGIDDQIKAIKEVLEQKE